jgi:hypothetical protein
MGPTVVFATSHAKSSASILTAVDCALSHVLRVPMRSVLLAALTVNAACPVELPAIGSLAHSAVKTLSSAVINVRASVVHLVQKYASVKNVLMETPSLA